MMRIAAIVLNFILLGTVAFLFATEGAPSEGEWLFVILMIAAPLCSLIALFVLTGDGWLALYFKRKALEEKKKIDGLGENNES